MAIIMHIYIQFVWTSTNNEKWLWDPMRVVAISVGMLCLRPIKGTNLRMNKYSLTVWSVRALCVFKTYFRCDV